MQKSTIMLLILVLVLMPLSLAEDACLDFQAPDAPTGLTLSGNVNLEWTASADGPANCSSGVDYYLVYRDYVLIGTTPSTSYEDGPLSAGTYTYNVAAVDQLGNGEGAAATESITIEGNLSGETLSDPDQWDCISNSFMCINGTETLLCTHKTMEELTKIITQNCTMPIIQQTNQTTVQNQTQSQTRPKKIIINQTQNQTEPKTIMINQTQNEEPTENLTGHNVIIVNIPMRMPEEKEATKATATVKEQKNEQEIELTREADGSNVPWALIIFCIGLIGATLVLMLMLRKSEKEKMPAQEEKEEKWMELEVPGGRLEVPSPFGPPKVEREDKWVELNELPVPNMPERRQEKWIEIKVPAWRKRNAKKKALAANNVKKKTQKKKPVRKKR